jgi:cytochrome c oxidase assembly factor CtaG
MVETDVGRSRIKAQKCPRPLSTFDLHQQAKARIQLQWLSFARGGAGDDYPLPLSTAAPLASSLTDHACRSQPARRIAKSRPVALAIRVLQQPVLAVLLFVGPLYFWLIPPVHFRAMIDPRLYLLMNASMVLDGLLFWSLVLDPRPQPPARLSFVARFVLAVVVMFPQIALGAVIALTQRDLYPYYDLCGRLYPSLDALADQTIGGIVIWIPPVMMSVIGALLVVNALRIHEETNAHGAALAGR